MKGSKLANQFGTYGSQGVASAINSPGARNDIYTWTDASGNFWLFGGYGYDKYGNQGLMTDLWKYTPATNEWIWIKGDSMCNKLGVYGTQGVAAPTNKPGARYGGTFWRDNNGNLWLFGGIAITVSGLGYVNDLWKYSISTNQWTWMGGTSATNQLGNYGVQGTASPFNIPGARTFMTPSVDAAGNFWLFGGFGYSAGSVGLMNDLWKYNPATTQWTWVSGTNTVNVNGIYGSLGTASVTNMPGARQAAYAWSDANNFWLFGGNGMDATNTPSMTMYMNDIWKYNYASGQWTWVKGSNIGTQPGTYGAQEVFANANTPGGHVGGLSWKDSNGKFWIFGGHGMSVNAFTGGKMSDLWKYDPVINQWAWMQGNQLPDQHGLYGTQGVASIANAPGSRASAGGWIDNNNDIWIFAGFGWPETGSINLLNDLWKYTNCSSQSLTISSTASVLCSGASATLNPSGGNFYTWSSNQSGNNAIVSPTITTTYSVTSSFNNGCVKTFPVTQSVSPPPFLNVGLNPAILCSGSSSTLMVSGANSYTWSNTQTGSATVVSPTVNTSYTVSGTNSLGCIGTATLLQNVSPLPTVSASSSTNQICSGNDFTLSAIGANSYSWSNGQTGSVVVTNISANTNYTVNGYNAFNCSGNATVMVNVLPLPTIAISSSHSVVCVGETVTLTASGAGTYTWVNYGNASNIVISPISTTVYTLSGTGTNGCSNEINFTQNVDPCAGISSFKNQSEHFFVYPNPANDWFEIKTDCSGEFVLRDVLGREIVRCEINGSKRFDRKQLSAGTYFYSFLQNGAVNLISAKLILN